MYRRSNTALALAAAIILLPLDAHAGFKPGAHPTASAIHHGNHARFADHRRGLHRIHKFSHRRRDFLALGAPFTIGDIPFYGSYYDPSDSALVDPAPFSETGPFTGSIRPRGFYRTGCRSEDVSVPSAHGQTTVTVTRCSVPILESPALK